MSATAVLVAFPNVQAQVQEEAHKAPIAMASTVVWEMPPQPRRGLNLGRVLNAFASSVLASHMTAVVRPTTAATHEVFGNNIDAFANDVLGDKFEAEVGSGVVDIVAEADEGLRRIVLIQLQQLLLKLVPICGLVYNSSFWNLLLN